MALNLKSAILNQINQELVLRKFMYEYLFSNSRSP